MMRSVKNFILMTLMASAFCITGLSAVSAENPVGAYIYEETETIQAFDLRINENFENVRTQHLDFWDKFRDSVMPDENSKNKKKEDNREKPENSNSRPENSRGR